MMVPAKILSDPIEILASVHSCGATWWPNGATMFNKFIAKISQFNSWVLGLGLGGFGLALVWVIKALICAFTGYCLL